MQFISWESKNLVFMSLSASHNLNSSKHFRALGKLELMSYKPYTYVLQKLKPMQDITSTAANTSGP